MRESGLGRRSRRARAPCLLSPARDGLYYIDESSNFKNVSNSSALIACEDEDAAVSLEDMLTHKMKGLTLTITRIRFVQN